MVSFSRNVKEEISLSEYNDDCSKSLLLAVIKLNGTLSLNNLGLSLTVRTENAKIASKIHQIFKKLYSPEIEFKVSKKMKLKKNNVYFIKVNKAREILDDLEILSGLGFEAIPSPKVIGKQDTIRAFLAGCFLASGSVNNPQTSNYHLEMSCHEEAFSNYIINILSDFDIHAKSIQRRNKYTVYVKSAEKIGDFLRLIGANNALMEFETARIDRDFINNLNRVDNCEIANEMKTQRVAEQQIEDILYIIEMRGLASMDDKTKQVALLRLDNPDRSLNELCEVYNTMYMPSITKSGMNHRFRKIKDMASTLKMRDIE